MSIEHDNMSGAGKAAFILSVVGEELAAEVVRRLGPDERELVGAALVAAAVVPDDIAMDLVGRFLADAERFGKAGGGVDFARNVLDRALGTDAAKSVMTRLEAVDLIANASVERLKRLIKGEHPQVGALVVSQLDALRASTLLEAVEPGMRQEIAERAGKISYPSTVALCDVAGLINRTQV